MSLTSLPDDVWKFIGLKLYVEDRIRFGACCKSWHSLIPKTPLLMLAESEEERESDDESLDKPYESEDEDEDEDAEDEESSQETAVEPPPRRFVCVGEEEHIYEIKFPEIHHSICVGSIDDWLVLAHRDKTINLFSPFSRKQIYLPSQLKFERGIFVPGCYRFTRILLHKVILSSSPSKGQGWIAMAIHNTHKILAIARFGDPDWTTVQGGEDDWQIHDAVFYKGHFYAINWAANLFVIDGLNPPRASSLMKSSPLEGDLIKSGRKWIHYLVECVNQLLLVIKWLGRPPDSDRLYRTFNFQVYKFDFIHGNWNELNTLGEYSLFLGYNTSVSLRALDYFGLIRKNSIYFTDDYKFGYRGYGTKGGHDMGVFDLDDKSIQPHFKGESTSFYLPPLWIVPN